MSSCTASRRVCAGGSSRPFSSWDAASSQSRNAATSCVRVVAVNWTAWSWKPSRLRRACTGSSPGSAASSISRPSTVSTSWITVVSSSPSTLRRSRTSRRNARNRRTPSALIPRPREETQPSGGSVSSASIRLARSTMSAMTTGSSAFSPVVAASSAGSGSSPRAARSWPRSRAAAQSPSAARSRAPSRHLAPASNRARASERPGSVRTWSIATTSATSGVCNSPPSPTTS